MKNNLKSVPILNKKMIIPFILVCTIFGLWGLASAVTDPMVQAFKKVLELSNGQAAWVQMAFYGGYFCMALPAAVFVNKFNYKVGIIVGLALYGIGALLFYPAAMTEQFWFFCLSLYVLTFGLAFLETTAHPYIITMGNPLSGTRRLNFAQSFNSVGMIVGLLIAQKFILKKLQSDDIKSFESLDDIHKITIRTLDLLVIRDPYVVLGIVVLVYLLIIGILKMPMNKNLKATPPLGKTLARLSRNKIYRIGFIAQVFYVGVQIMCWTYIYQYAEAKGIGSNKAANYQFVAFILFLGGRVIGTYLVKYYKASLLLKVFAIFGIISCFGTIFFTNLIGLYMLVITSFFMSIMWPTIYGETLRDLKSKDIMIGAAGLVMAIGGGALMPKLQGDFIDIGGNGVSDVYWLGIPEVNWSFILPLFCFVYIVYYSHQIMINEKIEF